MKIYICVDLEGISGVFREAQTDELGSPEHRTACKLMRGDLDAALAGCADAGAVEILVCDAHYEGTNLGVEGLPTNVTLISGATPHLSMMEGVDASFDAALLVGFHAMAGTRAAVLAHTFTDIITRVTVLDPDCEESGVAGAGSGAAGGSGATRDRGAGAAGYVTGEFGLCAAVAGAFGVPVVFTSGDDKLAAEARELLPGVEVAVTKTGLARSSARLRAPEAARADIRAGVARALAAARVSREGVGGGGTPSLEAGHRPDGRDDAGVASPPPTALDWNGRVLRVALANPANCDLAARCPTVSRLDGTTIEITARDYLTAWRTFVAAASLAHE